MIDVLCGVVKGAPTHCPSDTTSTLTVATAAAGYAEQDSAQTPIQQPLKPGHDGDRNSRITGEAHMMITVAAVYEGGGVLKLEQPVDIKHQARVIVTIEATPDASVGLEDNDPTGWKAAAEFIGMWKDAPARTSLALSEQHDRVLYKRR